MLSSTSRHRHQTPKARATSTSLAQPLQPSASSKLPSSGPQTTSTMFTYPTSLNFTEWIPTCTAIISPPTSTSVTTWCWLHSSGTFASRSTPNASLNDTDSTHFYPGPHYPEPSSLWASFWELLRLPVASLFGVLVLYVLIRMLFTILDCFMPEDREQGKSKECDEARDTDRVE